MFCPDAVTLRQHALTINISQVHYDASGNVRKVGEKERFWLDARGKLREFVVAGENTRVALHHDHLGRLVAWHDSNGRARQYFYSNPQDHLEVNCRTSMTH